jgi:hypothetical protein
VRRQIPLVITFVVGFYMIVEYFFSLPMPMKDWGRYITNFGVVVLAFALGVGAIVTLTTHARRIQKRTAGEWQYSLALIATFILFLVVGLSLTTKHPTWDWLYQAVMLPLYATTYSMWVFYMASGAYRSFRVRSKEAAVLLFSGCLVMLGNVPIGEAIWSMFPLVRDWIMAVPNMAANRGIIMGAALGAIILGLRVLLGRETGYLGTRE